MIFTARQLRGRTRPKSRTRPRQGNCSTPVNKVATSIPTYSPRNTSPTIPSLHTSSLPLVLCCALVFLLAIPYCTATKTSTLLLTTTGGETTRSIPDQPFTNDPLSRSITPSSHNIPLEHHPPMKDFEEIAPSLALPQFPPASGRQPPLYPNAMHVPTRDSIYDPPIKPEPLTDEEFNQTWSGIPGTIKIGVLLPFTEPERGFQPILSRVSLSVSEYSQKISVFEMITADTKEIFISINHSGSPHGS